MANRYWVGGTGTWDDTDTTNWSATSGGAGGASAPTTADTIFFDTNSGTAATVTVAATATGGAVTVDKSDINLVLSGSPTFTGLWILTSGILNLDNNNLTVLRFSCSVTTVARTVAFGTGGIYLTGNATTVLAWGNANLTATGSKNIYATYSGGTGTRTFSMNATGAIEANIPNIFVTSGTDTVTLGSRSGTINFTGFKGTYNSAVAKSIFGGLIFDPDMTITGSTSTHNFTATTGPYIIRTANLAMDFPISFSSIAIGGVWEFDDALTMASGRRFAVNAGTVKFKAGTTNTSGEFVFVGTSAVGRQVTIASTTTGVKFTLSQPSGTVTAQYTSISDSNATGGATWIARTDLGCKDVSNNTGWNFISVGLQQIFQPIFKRIFRKVFDPL
jgi:hypothetical protein